LSCVFFTAFFPDLTAKATFTILTKIFPLYFPQFRVGKAIAILSGENAISQKAYANFHGGGLLLPLK
jgi:hypothetical protein